MKKWVWLCLSLPLLSGCGQHEKKEPQVNPHPKYRVIISGNIAPNLKWPMYFGFWATYAAYNPKCKVDVNAFEGVSGQPGHPIFYPVKPDKKGDYQIKIPIDYYLPGKCDWKIAWIDYAYGYHPIPKNKDDADSVGTAIQFGNRDSGQENPAFPLSNSVTLHECGRNLDFCGDSLAAGYTKRVSRKRSYHFIQNVKE